MKAKQVAFNILFIVVILCGCTQMEVSTGPKREAVSYTEKSVSVSTPVQLDVIADSSNIEVYSWRKNEVKFEITKKVRGVKTEDELNKQLSNFNISIVDEADNRVVLNSEYNGKIKNPADIYVNFKIYIPKRISLFNLKLDTGRIKFFDDISCVLNSEVNMANIEINKFEGRIQSTADMGDIRIAEGMLWKDSRIKTNMGNISIKSEIESLGEYSFQTGMGNIELILNENSVINVESVGNLQSNEFTTQPEGAKIKVRSDMGRISIRKY